MLLAGDQQPRSVLPDGEVGMASMKATWWMRLQGATRAAT